MLDRMTSTISDFTRTHARNRDNIIANPAKQLARYDSPRCSRLYEIGLHKIISKIVPIDPYTIWLRIIMFDNNIILYYMCTLSMLLNKQNVYYILLLYASLYYTLKSL